jgi:hypothetical protein
VNEFDPNRQIPATTLADAMEASYRAEIAALRAERDALATRVTALESALTVRVAALENALRPSLEAMQMADTRVIGLTGSEYRQWVRAIETLRATLAQSPF